ncbi:MAG TPA: sugar transferase [Actinomycetota bacterium]|nr:sugar transferase [Actinomycetota bacterium]
MKAAGALLGETTITAAVSDAVEHPYPVLRAPAFEDARLEAGLSGLSVDVAGVTRRQRDARRTFGWITAGMAATDALSIALALFLVEFVLLGGREIFLGVAPTLILFTVPFGWVATFFVFGLYAPRHLSAVDEFRRIIGASSFGLVAMVMGGFWSATEIGRSTIGITWALALVSELLTRRVWRLEVRRRRTEGTLAMRTLIVGTNDEALRLASELETRGSGFSPVGFVAAASTNVQPSGIDVVGGIHRLADAIRERDVESLFVASSAVRSDEMLNVLQAARQANVDVRISAQIPEILASRVAIQNVGSSMALAVRPLQLSRAQRLLKRAFDLVVAGAVLVVTLPAWAVIGACIRLTSAGPAFFTQTRVTQGGRTFRMIKFRTMVTDAEARGIEVDTSQAFFKMADDPRITRIGRFLRKTSLDELPQLVNVIKGEMSLVGPRPLPEDQVAAHPELLSGRLEVQAGMTGWWQIQGRSDVSPEEAVRMDVFYIENWSLSLDLYVLARTAGVVLARSGAV